MSGISSALVALLGVASPITPLTVASLGVLVTQTAAPPPPSPPPSTWRPFTTYDIDIEALTRRETRRWHEDDIDDEMVCILVATKH